MIRMIGRFSLCCYLMGCNHQPVGLHKAGLLDPMMDPEKTAGCREEILLSEPMLSVEKALIGGQSGFGSSCPACGG